MDRWATIAQPASRRRSSTQPPAMRWRAVNVLTNTPPRSQQRSPGPMQANGIIDPVVSKAATPAWARSGRDSRDQCAGGQGACSDPPGRTASANHVTSAFVKEALDRGAALFNWNDRKARAGQRQGSKVRGVGVAVGPHGAGSIGWDSIMTIRPDGRL